MCDAPCGQSLVVASPFAASGHCHSLAALPALLVPAMTHGHATDEVDWQQTGKAFPVAASGHCNNLATLLAWLAPAMTAGHAVDELDWLPEALHGVVHERMAQPVGSHSVCA